MKGIFKIFFTAITLLCILSCGNTKKISQNDNMYGSMRGIDCIMEKYQVDSMCFADNILSLDKWFHMSYTDYETGAVITKYVYAKIDSEKSETVYIVIPKNDAYKVTKRIVTE